MGKELKNREIGKGLSQRNDGHCSAGFLSKTGVRTSKKWRKIQMLNAEMP